MPILAEPMFDVNPKKTAMTPKELLLYCYYGGMIHIGQQHSNFSVAFLSPTVLACRGQLCLSFA